MTGIVFILKQCFQYSTSVSPNIITHGHASLICDDFFSFPGWPVALQKAMLLLYKKHDKSVNKWHKIAQGLKKQFPGRNIGNDQCRVKYRGLQRKYQRRTKHNQQSSNEPKDIEHWLLEAFEMEFDGAVPGQVG